jgi:hypothetical protein
LSSSIRQIYLVEEEEEEEEEQKQALLWRSF